jgi:hypothetical protein
MLDFSLKLRPFGKTYWTISPKDMRIRQCFISLNGDLAHFTNSTKTGNSLIEHALELGWVIVELVKETSGLGTTKGNYHAVVKAGYHCFKNNSILLNKLVGLLKLLEHNAQANGRLHIHLSIYRMISKPGIREKQIIQEKFISSASFAHLIISQSMHI